jgi:low temperature requirement protein LtrA
MQRPVTWIELFFDLVFIAAIHYVTTAVATAHHNGETATFMISAFLFLTVLWTWVNHTLFSTHFLNRMWFYSIITFLQMLSVIALIIAIPYAQELPQYFIWAQIASKILLVMQYALSVIFNLGKIFLTIPLVISYTGVAVLWYISLIAPIEQLYWWWIAAFLLDFATPLFGRLKNIDYDSFEHIPERFGLLVVIMLGELIITLVTTMLNVPYTLQTIQAFSLGVLVVGAIFAVYFRFIQNHVVGLERSMSNIYLYAHIPLVIGLICIAAGFETAILHQSGDWLLLVGFSLFIVSFQLLHFVADNTSWSRQLIFIGLLLPLFAGYFLYAGTNKVILITLALLCYLAIYEIMLPSVQRSRAEKSDDKVKWNF